MKNYLLTSRLLNLQDLVNVKAALLILPLFFMVACKNSEPSALKPTDAKTTENADPNTQLTIEDLKTENSSASAAKKEEIPIPEGVEVDEWTIIPGRQVGNITVATTHESLIKEYGAENIKTKRMAVGDLIGREATILFPDTKNEAFIFWTDTIKRATPIQVLITQKGGNWQTHHGLKIGSTIAEVKKVNERAPMIAGFGYVYKGIDVSGMVYDWQEGRLNNYFGMVFTPSEKGKKHVAYKDFYSEEGAVFKTDDNRVDQMELTVSQMKVMFKN